MCIQTATGTFEFDAPDGPENPDGDISGAVMERTFMKWRKKGRKNQSIEEFDDGVYFLSLTADQWIWSKPLIHGVSSTKPPPRCEHSATKTGANEVTIFGGWAHRPMNDLWSFNFVDMEWKSLSTSGIQPRPRYRHTSELIGSKLFILGGSENGEDVADTSRNVAIHELNLQTMQWTHPTLKGANPFPRSGHGSSVIGAKSIAIFGGKRSNEVQSSQFIH